MKLIDKDKITAELEKRRKSNSKNKLNLPAAFEDNYLLSFLDTLEVEEVDFKKVFEWLENHNDYLRIHDNGRGVRFDMTQCVFDLRKAIEENKL